MMLENTGLGQITDPNIIMSMNLGGFVATTQCKVIIIKDDTDIPKMIRDQMKANLTGKSMVFVFAHEILYQYQTMTKICPGVHIFYGSLSSGL